MQINPKTNKVGIDGKDIIDPNAEVGDADSYKSDEDNELVAAQDKKQAVDYALSSGKNTDVYVAMELMVSCDRIP